MEQFVAMVFTTESRIYQGFLSQTLTIHRAAEEVTPIKEKVTPIKENIMQQLHLDLHI